MTENSESEDGPNASRIEAERQHKRMWTRFITVIAAVYLFVGGRDLIHGNVDGAIGAAVIALVLLSIVGWANWRSPDGPEPTTADA